MRIVGRIAFIFICCIAFSCSSEEINPIEVLEGKWKNLDKNGAIASMLEVNPDSTVGFYSAQLGTRIDLIIDHLSAQEISFSRYSKQLGKVIEEDKKVIFSLIRKEFADATALAYTVESNTLQLTNNDTLMVFSRCLHGICDLAEEYFIEKKASIIMPQLPDLTGLETSALSKSEADLYFGPLKGQFSTYYGDGPKLSDGTAVMTSNDIPLFLEKKSVQNNSNASEMEVLLHIDVTVDAQSVQDLIDQMDIDHTGLQHLSCAVIDRSGKLPAIKKIRNLPALLEGKNVKASRELSFEDWLRAF